MGRKLDASLAILNGAIGDYLARTANGLATELTFVEQVGAAAPLVLNRHALDRAYPAASGRAAIFVHGLMSTETVWEMKDGTDYGTRLACDLGISPLYVRYNSGRAIAANGADLAHALETLVDAYPGRLEEIVLIGHSMGGLVVRSACHKARLRGSTWLSRVPCAIYVGTPHLGTPLERVGRTVASVLGAIDDPYTRLIAQIANLRSEGVKDLGDAHHPVPLLAEIQHYLVAGSLSGEPWLGALFGDSLVSIRSATAGHVDLSAVLGGDPIPPNHVKLIAGLSHVALAHDPRVYAWIRDWCATSRQPEDEARTR